MFHLCVSFGVEFTTSDQKALQNMLPFIKLGLF